MKEYEYKVVGEISPLNMKNLDAILNARGEEGWKYVGNYSTWMIFIREKDIKLKPNPDVAPPEFTRVTEGYNPKDIKKKRGE